MLRLIMESNQQMKEELGNKIGDTNKKIEENSKKMEEKMDEIKNDNKLLMEENIKTVSYTHLDVYKRQALNNYLDTVSQIVNTLTLTY